LARAPAAVVPRRRQVELLSRAGHRNVEQSPLLLEAEVWRRRSIPEERLGQLEDVAPARPWKPTLRQPHDEHHAKLEAFRLVDGEDAPRGHVAVRLGDRRVLAGLDQSVEMVHELAYVVPGKDPRRVLDPPEEACDVLDLGLLADRARPRHLAQPAGVSE